MFRLTPLLLSFLFFISTPLSLSFTQHQQSYHEHEQLPTRGFAGRNYGSMVSWGAKRFLAEIENNSSDASANDEAPLNSSSLILAAKRTYRKDPLNDFKKYTDGWNISNVHYWASVGYTAVPFFTVALVWFALFALFLFITCLHFCCCRKEPYGYSRVAYALSLILLILFTVVAIVGCIILYSGQEKFYHSTTDTLGYVVYQANNTAENLRNVSGYLAAAKQVGIAQVFLPANVQTDIDQIQNKINSSATTLSVKAVDNSKDIKHVISSVRVCLIVLSAVMLFLTFIGFVLSIFGLQALVYILVIAGWILVTATFILCGVFLLLHNVTADTCVSMEQWVDNPTAHTSLDDILPCVDNVTAQETLMKSKEVTGKLVDVINQVITNMSNINFAPNFVPLYYNQSGPLLPLLCNPFFPDLTNRSCTPGEVDLNNATQVWGNYVCRYRRAGVCETTGRLTPSIYSQMAAGVNVSFGLYHYGPYLVSLQDCTFVRQTFTDVYSGYCPGLLRYSKLVYIGLVMVAVSGDVVVAVLGYLRRERRHRVYTKDHMPRRLDNEDKFN